MKRSVALLSLLLPTLAAGRASAGIESHTFDYLSGPDLLWYRELAKFDTRGGTRELAEVRIGVDFTYAYAWRVREYDLFGPPDEDWQVEQQLSAAVSFYSGWGYWLLPERISLGNVVFDPIHTDLLPDAWTYGQSTAQLEAQAALSVGAGDYLGLYEGTGSLLLTDASWQGFILPLGQVQFEGLELVASGTITLDYVYDTVPTPASVAVLGVLGLMGGSGSRRRR